MNKGLKLLTASLAIAGVMIFSAVGSGFAAGPQDTLRGQGTTIVVVSKLLGLTPEEIHAQRAAGKSLVAIAATKGVGKDALVNAILSSKKEVLDQRVKAGTLTREIAEQHLEIMKQRVSQSVERTTIGPPADRPGFGPAMPGLGKGPGQMRGWGKRVGPGPGFGATPGAGLGTPVR